jgi:hypothetical protein
MQFASTFSGGGIRLGFVTIAAFKKLLASGGFDMISFQNHRLAMPIPIAAR